jgi:CYTH domain-containing protein
MEIERKFLVTTPPAGLRTAPSVAIRQGYITTGLDGEVRLRDADGICTLTVKSGSGIVREEREIPIDREQFDALWPATAGRRLEKRRYLLTVDGLTYEVDVYEGSLAGLIIAEVEFSGIDGARGFTPPGWFGTTEDIALSNASLALNGIPRPGTSDARGIG